MKYLRLLQFVFFLLLLRFTPAAGQTPDSTMAATQTADTTVAEKAISPDKAEQRPKFQGGDEKKFARWVAEHMEYPITAKTMGITGRVICTFVIDKEGQVTNVKVVRKVHPSLDQEAVRIISMSPKWTPGVQKGKEVRVRYTFPIIFNLNNKNNSALQPFDIPGTNKSRTPNKR